MSDNFKEGYSLGEYYSGIGKALKDKLQLGENNIVSVILNIIAVEGNIQPPESQTNAIGFNANQTSDEDYSEEDDINA